MPLNYFGRKARQEFRHQDVSLEQAMDRVAIESGFRSWADFLAAPAIEQHLAATMARVPGLSDDGMGRGGDREGRARLWARVDMIAKVVVWLQERVAPTRTFNARRTSRELRRLAARDLGEVSHGAFIAAAIIAGFPYRAPRGSPSVVFGMSDWSLKALDEPGFVRRRDARGCFIAAARVPG